MKDHLRDDGDQPFFRYVAFSSPHAPLVPRRDNTSADRIRLAGSFRYQPIGQPVDEGALMPQHHYAEREVLYANWAYADWPYDDPLKYYSRSLSLDVQPAWHPPAENR